MTHACNHHSVEPVEAWVNLYIDQVLVWWPTGAHPAGQAPQRQRSREPRRLHTCALPTPAPTVWHGGLSVPGIALQLQHSAVGATTCQTWSWLGERQCCHCRQQRRHPLLLQVQQPACRPGRPPVSKRTSCLLLGSRDRGFSSHASGKQQASGGESAVAGLDKESRSKVWSTARRASDSSTLTCPAENGKTVPRRQPSCKNSVWAFFCNYVNLLEHRIVRLLRLDS